MPHRRMLGWKNIRAVHVGKRLGLFAAQDDVYSDLIENGYIFSFVFCFTARNNEEPIVKVYLVVSHL